MILMILAVATAFTATASAQLDDPVKAFGSMPLLQGIEASPDGTMLAARVTTSDFSGLGILKVDGEKIEYLRFMKEKDDLKIQNFLWKSNDLLAVGVGMPSRRYGTATFETRMVSMTPSGSDMRSLYREKRGSQSVPPQLQANVVSRLPNDPKHILVQYSLPTEEDTFVYKMRVDRPARHRLVSPRVRGSRYWRADRTGELRSVSGLRNEKERILRFKLPDGEWKDASHRLAPGQPNFRVLGFSPDPKIAYITSDHATATMALYSYDVTTDTIGEEIYHNPNSDVYGISLSPRNGQLIGVTYGEADIRVHRLRDSIVKKVTDIVERSTGAEDVAFHSINDTETMAIVSISQGVRPSQYLALDLKNSRLIALPSQYPDLDAIDLGGVAVTSYKARDGLEIPAFVTLPPGVNYLAEMRNRPFVILPHGGPNSRDFAEFDWWTQFLAHRGFGVLQMNFRGSAGYGAEFKGAGDRQWGQAMQDDITDGTRWLINEGHADPQRIIIMGGSYGGYAALMGAVKTPDLYRCAVSVNGVSDLPSLLSNARNYVDGTASRRHIGRWWSDRAMLRENSPARRADDIKVPVLLVHGEKDRRVPVAQSRRMRRALERAGKDVRYVELPDGSHFLNVNDNRQTFLREVDQFLTRCR